MKGVDTPHFKNIPQLTRRDCHRCNNIFSLSLNCRNTSPSAGTISPLYNQLTYVYHRMLRRRTEAQTEKAVLVTYGQVPERDSEGRGGRFLLCHSGGSCWHLVARSSEGSMPSPSLHLISAGTELVTAPLAAAAGRAGSGCGQWRNVYSPCLSLQPLGSSWSPCSRLGQTEQWQGGQGVCTAPPLPVYSSHTSVGSVAAISYLSPMLPPSKRSLWSCHQPGHCTQPYTGQQALH